MELQETTNEVITVLSNAEDEESLEKIAKNFDEVQEIRLQEEDDFNNSLLALAKILHEQEEKIKASKLDESSNRINSLQDDKKTTTQFIEKLEDDVKVLEKNIYARENEITDLKVRAAEVKENQEEVLPKKRYIFSLYTNVSHIRWDYECQEDHVKGFMANLNDVKPFCLNKSEKSAYDIANHLWDIMED